MKFAFCLQLILSTYIAIVSCIFNSSDNELFSINWSGDSGILNTKNVIEQNSFFIKSKDQETYVCYEPINIKDKHSKKEEPPYTGPTELELISKLKGQYPCSYKIETFWSYEMCHGKYLKQFHKDQVNPPQSMEFFLGYYQDGEMKETDNKPRNTNAPPTILLEGINYPYFQMNFTEGTTCDITGQSRKTSILYICHDEGRGELFAFTETSSCNYQAIVLSRQLCTDPRYKLPSLYVNDISCHPFPDSKSPKKPRSMTNIDFEIDQSLKKKFSSLDGLFGSPEQRGIKVEGTRQNGRVVLSVTKVATDKQSEEVSQKETERPDKSNKETSNEEQISGSAALLQSFMSGEYCVTGGTGWWRHQFCFKRDAVQFHQEPHQEATIIKLGTWNPENHIEWLARNPDKRPSMPAKTRLELIQYYGDGDKCPNSNEYREALVVIRCSDEVATNIVAAFQETQLCHYVFSIESSIFCPLIQQADENGIVPSVVAID